jgi:hypothetical protein
MPAGPGAETTWAPLQAPYQYTPVETRLNPPIHLDPVNYDALQKGISGLPGMLMQSALNPAVRNQMQAEAARYNLERKVISNLDQLPADEQMRRTGINAEGATVVPGYQTGNIGMPPASNVGGDQTQQTQQPSQQQPTTTQQQPPAAPTGQVTGQPTSTGQQFAAPASPYTPPAQVNPPAAPGQQPTQTPPQAAPNQPAPNQGIVQAGPDQQSLVAWQNQNAHPVMSSTDALNWAKNFDTGAQRATYMPSGGPNGEPAFAFHMKGGGVNTVPLSQMVKNGAGPLVASQNTSQVLNAQPQQQGPGQAPSAPGQQQPPQQPGAQPQPGQQPAPQGQQPLTPEQQNYLASQTAVPNLSASTNNDFLLKRNAQINATTGDTQLAPDTIRDNPSNVPRSTNPTMMDPVPPGEVQGQRNEAVAAQLEAVKKTAGGLNSLPDGPSPGQKLLMTTNRGINWYVDANPDPKDPDSRLPYLITNTSPWSENRMYNLEGTNWISKEVIRPDRLLDKQIYDMLYQDSTGWKTPDGQPDTARKINALRDHYAMQYSHPMDQATNDKLAAMRNQVLQSQRLLDATKHMTPDDYGWFRGVQNDIANNSNAFAGMPFADAWLKAAAKAIAPGGVDPRLQYMSNAYASLMGGRDDPALSPQERKELDRIGMNVNLPKDIQQLNYNRMAEYNRYANQAIANRYRISDDYRNTASSITANKRIPDGGTPEWSNLTNPRAQITPGTSPMVLRAQPVNPPQAPGGQAPQGPQAPQAPGPQAQATPQAQPATTQIKVPPNNSQANPVDMSTFSRTDGLMHARQLPRGTWVKDAQGNIGQIP